MTPNVTSPLRRKLLGIVTAVAMCGQATVASAQANARDDWRPAAIGLGAFAGVAAFNLLALGPAAMPGGFAYAAAETVPAEMSVAMSRVWATGAAALGGWAGYEWAGAPQPGDKDWLIDRRLLAAGGGAIAGAAVFNLLAAPFATVPLAGGALQAVPYDVALGSRLIAATTAGAGAIAADWLYSRWYGTEAHTSYLLTLGVGALAGVAVGNFVTAGTVGVVPYYPGAGAANAAGAFASAAAQAASRVYVVTYGVLGAWAADYLYRR